MLTSVDFVDIIGGKIEEKIMCFLQLFPAIILMHYLSSIQ